MRISYALAAALLVGVAAAPADAKTYCRLVREKPTDADPVYHSATRGTTPFGPYDLKSMDVATNATHLTGVIRVADLTNTSPTASQDGAFYTQWFSLDPERNYFFAVQTGSARDIFELYQNHEPWLAPEDERAPDGFVEMDTSRPVLLTDRVHGVVDRKTNELRMTVPLSVFGRGVMKRGLTLSHFGGNSASTKIQLDEKDPPNWPNVFSQHEDAISARRWESYPLGAPSCVRVGR